MRLIVHSCLLGLFFFFSSRRRHTRLQGDWSSDVCSSDLHRLRSGLVRHGAEAVIAQNSGRVLVVDDDPEIVTFLSTLLELEGIESSVAKIGRASCRERV